MEPFIRVEGVAAPIDERNLDTNQLCPTRFNKLAIGDPFYPRVLFNNQRFDANGEESAGFILNRGPFREACILVGNENFGCGSSRESAVYALQAFGIRSVIAPDFGDIFRGNALSNGLLPVVLDAAVCDRLRAELHTRPGARVAVDLEAREVRCEGLADRIAFDVDAAERDALLRGLDAVGLTLERVAAIHDFEASHRATMPWFFARD